MKIYGISIRPTRLAALTQRLDGVSFTVVDGVNGTVLSMKELAVDKIYKPLSYMKLTRGAIGCFLSHRSVWDAILNGPDEHALILEDDADFRPEFIPKVEQLVEQIQAFDPSWNLLIIGQQTRTGTRGVKVPPGFGFYVPSRAFGLHAYVVSKRGAAILLSKSLPIFDPVDCYVTSFPCRGKYGTVANICDTLNFGSDVVSIV